MMDETLQCVLILLKAIPVAFVALMPVINPIGTGIILLGMTEGASGETRRALAKTIALNTIFLLTTTLVAGSYLLRFFGISIPIVQVAGGFVLAAMGWEMLQQKPEPPSAEPAPPAAVDPRLFFAKTFYPYTFPVTVGPGGVAVMLTLSAHTTHESLLDTVAVQAGTFVGILGIAVAVYLAFAYSNRLAARLGPAGTSAMMRLIAFVVVCIGANIGWTGVKTLLLELHGAG